MKIQFPTFHRYSCCTAIIATLTALISFFLISLKFTGIGLWYFAFDAVLSFLFSWLWMYKKEPDDTYAKSAMMGIFLGLIVSLFLFAGIGYFTQLSL